MPTSVFSPRDAMQLLTLLLIAVCLVPAGAHLFELPNKMALTPAQYMTVQGIYAGWAWFGLAIFPAIVLTAAHTLMVRGHTPAFYLSLAALVLLVVTQVLFWAFTYPMNVASSNWTTMPDNFEAARRQWEYSHAVNALLTFAALAAITASALSAPRAIATVGKPIAG